MPTTSNKAIVDAYGVNSYVNTDSGQQVVGSFSTYKGEREVIRTEVYYANTVNTDIAYSVDFVDGSNRLGYGLGFQSSGGRDNATKYTGIPTEADFAEIEVQDTTIRYHVLDNENDLVYPQVLRDNGAKAFAADRMTIEKDELNKFAFVSDEAVVSNPVDAKVIVTFYKWS